MRACPVAILLAAGRGRRFDPDGRRNKLLQALPGGEPVVVASARKLLAAFPRVIAVTPPEDGGVGALLAALGCEVTVCADADSGMAASLVQALRHSLGPTADDPSSPRRRGPIRSLQYPAHDLIDGADTDSTIPSAWLIALGDMPHVASATLLALREALAAGAPIVAPVHDGRRGNPVGFSRIHLDALLALQGEQGARRLLQTCAVTEVAVNDPGILLDIDTPSDLAAS
ncbi:nucleotidyltransferase family protein [Massilia forsythiae]|uniref:Nucleotidyltransferase family protein n=1 Tax=Massilia forsythiae TaxID=2728020 RepID=A0A7Z2ZSY2_9BURK|nr:nucleotidyltransferase family protein [Massilia forsythiae]QJD99441.1 nucleotidyltransferase family protein [Massilia forsythiae]